LACASFGGLPLLLIGHVILLALSNLFAFGGVDRFELGSFPLILGELPQIGCDPLRVRLPGSSRLRGKGARRSSGFILSKALKVSFDLLFPIDVVAMLPALLADEGVVANSAGL
jgi:hypothetical protein